MDIAYDAMFTLSLPDSRITYWNAGAENLYGWTAAEAIGQVPSDLLHTELDRPRADVVAEVVREGRWAGRLLQRHRDGRMLTVEGRWALQTDPSGSPIGIFEINRDITAEQAAIERDAEKAALLDLASDAVLTFGLPDSRITYWNSGATSLYGWTAAQALGHRPYELLQTEHDRPRADITDEVVRTGRWAGRIVQRHRDGRKLIVEGRWALQTDKSGRPKGVLEINRDMTAELAAEVAKAKALNVISHELRTPLAVIKGYTSLFVDGSLGAVPAPWQKPLAIMSEKIEHLERLVELAIASADLGRVPELRPIDLRPLVDDALARAVERTTVAPEVELAPSSSPVVAVADPLLVGTILDNLIDNALSYSSAPPSIRIWTQPDPGPQVFVEDRGVGIAAADQPDLFGAFIRLNLERFADRPGSGLGLYMTRRLARVMGGDVTLEKSAVGVGSVFKLTLLPADSRGG
ncbi:MAG TPA: PAS domain-containing sensor histidine kinase [Candidatus Sulfotelmatobacter sp.]|nr:PAS domain-containing sensor histidine kinase [Candidatus Sulfotelmatobacter sp.]